MPLKVLHVSQPSEGGVARVVSQLASEQADGGHEVAVAAPCDGELQAALLATRVRTVEWLAGREPGPSVVFETRELGRIISAETPDIVHLHSSKAGLCGRLGLRGGVATVFQPHSWSFEAQRGPLRAGAAWWERASARWADVIVCVSEGERERGVEAGIRASFHVVRNGVDLAAFRTAEPGEREDVRRRLPIENVGAPLAVCVGRLCRQKGQDVLVRAWPLVRALVPDARLALVGGGPDEEELRRTAGPGVQLLGPRSDVRDWFVAADVAVFPSRWEGLSLALLEALACGRSVVATDVPGAREAIGADAGAIVGIEAVDELADAVTRRLLQAEQSAHEGRAGRRRVEALYDLRMTHERMAGVYSRVLERRRHERPTQTDARATRPAR